MSDIGGPDISEVSVVPALFSERADLKKDVVGSNPLVEMAGYKDPMQFDPEDRGTGPCRLMTEDIVPDLSKNPKMSELFGMYFRKSLLRFSIEGFSHGL